MKPVRITITDWGPFKGSQTFEFPQAPGLYFLWGRNEAQPRLGGNGAGKTRLFEALVWVFYGKTSRGLKASEVANWEVGKDAAVAFTYSIDGLRATVERRWSPNSWTLTNYDSSVIDLTRDETNPALGDLRLSFESFLNVVLMAQTRPMFLDLKSDAKAALFSEVMGLDRWLDASKKAGQKAQTEDSKCREVENQVARLEGQLEQLGRQSDDIEVQASGWEAQRIKTLAELESLHDEAMERRKQAKAALIEAENGEATAYALLRKEDSGRIGDPGFMSQLEDSVLDCREVVTRRQVALEDLDRVADFLDTNDTCLHCGQDITQKYRAAEARRVSDRRGALVTEIARGGEELEEAQSRLIEEQDSLEAMVKAHSKARRAVDLAATILKDARNSLAKVDRELDDLEAQSEITSAKKNPHKVFKVDHLEQEATVRVSLRHERRLLDDGLGRYRVFSQWVRWFKELRLELIGEALSQLEVEVNSEVSALGLVGWTLTFQIDRETASGSLQRGFIVMVTSPDNRRPVPWESWSGGEAQRLRVAAQCGLANLIRAHTGATINLEGWDEPTTGMSPQGIADLLRALEQRAEVEDRQVWIIDHHALSFGGFAGSAGVIKTKAGSQFDQDGLYISGTRDDLAQQSAVPRAKRHPLHDGLGFSPRPPNR